MPQFCPSSWVPRLYFSRHRPAVFKFVRNLSVAIGRNAASRGHYRICLINLLAVLTLSLFHCFIVYCLLIIDFCLLTAPLTERRESSFSSIYSSFTCRHISDAPLPHARAGPWHCQYFLKTNCRLYCSVWSVASSNQRPPYLSPVPSVICLSHAVPSVLLVRFQFYKSTSISGLRRVVVILVFLFFGLVYLSLIPARHAFMSYVGIGSHWARVLHVSCDSVT